MFFIVIGLILFEILEKTLYSETCVKRSLKKDDTKVLKTSGSLAHVKSTGAFCNTFDLY